MKTSFTIYLIGLFIGFTLFTLASPLFAADQTMTRQDVLTIFQKQMRLNEELISSVETGYSKAGKSYKDIKKDVEAYHEGPYIEAVKRAQDLICRQKDKELLKQFLKVLIATSNSADEFPLWSFGRVFICQPTVVENEIYKLKSLDRLYISGALEFGFDNVVSTEAKDDKAALQLRKKVTVLAPANLNSVTVQFNLEKEKQLQVEVDKGHQPWRLEPVAVAHATLIKSTDNNVPFDKCTLKSKKEREAIVKFKYKDSYDVYLKQLINPNGIWTTIEIRIVE